MNSLTGRGALRTEVPHPISKHVGPQCNNEYSCAAKQVGAYRRLGELPTVLSANLRWLAGYRHERVRDQATVARIREVVCH
jgi:hypothetical protein